MESSETARPKSAFLPPLPPHRRLHPHLPPPPRPPRPLPPCQGSATSTSSTVASCPHYRWLRPPLEADGPYVSIDAPRHPRSRAQMASSTPRSPLSAPSLTVARPSFSTSSTSISTKTAATCSASLSSTVRSPL
ncbi:hypothetical protein PVAP13_2KG128416 [Panicum virgatum]|uniref:Uncharacterized protein n=1 Tax=Panicum virgatum TaxID=38727 RepID=A0A8T0W7W0_PANVG|nr:hypothetical protein PVAP13_2KG128416 [Panicum virgatum]